MAYTIYANFTISEETVNMLQAPWISNCETEKSMLSFLLLKQDLIYLAYQSLLFSQEMWSLTIRQPSWLAVAHEEMWFSATDWKKQMQICLI